MIREMTADDKEAVIQLALEFGEERLARDGIVITREASSQQFDVLFNSPLTIKLVAEDADGVCGMLAGYCAPMLFSPHIGGQEIVWYVRKSKRKYGLGLLKKYEKILKERNCDSIIMVGMEGDNSCSFYERMGYKKLQQHYIKRLV